MPRPAGPRGASLLLALLLPLAAAAQEVPALYDVTGVAANDVLNVRAGPAASQPILAELAPDAVRVEVTALSGTGWGRVNHGEGAGWVSMRYLARSAAPAWDQASATLACYGTEPFWSFELAGGSGRFESPDSAPQTVPVRERTSSSSRPDVLGITLADGFAVVRAQDCSDGMSDRAYGLSIDLFRAGRGLSGCCAQVR